VRRVAAFCREKGARAVLVFDGAPFRGELGGQELGGVSLRFPAPGEDADGVIRALVERSARPSELTVVTSDKALYSYAKTLGAAVLRAHEWNRVATRPARAPRQRKAFEASRSEKPSRESDVEGWLERFTRAGSEGDAEEPSRACRQPPSTRAKRR
jgi:predicted RNA-binding protein with PIN domain